MSDERIAVVEDEPGLQEILEFHLQKAGYEVDLYARGDDAWKSLQKTTPQAILLDLMLPGMDGLELLRRVQRHDTLARVPVLLLTAKGEEVDRIVGLELGADDYITKPFSPREVVLRVKAVLRRSGSKGSNEDQAEWLSVGSIRLDTEGHQVFLGDVEVVLTPTEFRLLALLLERRGRTQTRARLLSDVWGYADDIDSRTVDTHIRRLRKKLDPEAAVIETVMGVGYRIRRPLEGGRSTAC
ncbi:MAG: response regulator transcription factor [Thermoanaerobaculia bacterium]|nr:response regulator transcription factor [Thermoanaerobaculia bacterium]